MNVCVDQSKTRRYDATTGRPGRPSDSPYVRLDYTLNRTPGAGWVVADVTGRKVAFCPR